MTPTHKKFLVTLSALTAVAGPVALADAAGKSGHHAKKHHAAKRQAGTGTSSAEHRGNPNETALTGDTKTSAESAALAAVPGGTVRGSSTEDPAENTGAA